MYTEVQIKQILHWFFPHHQEEHALCPKSLFDGVYCGTTDIICDCAALISSYF